MYTLLTSRSPWYARFERSLRYVIAAVTPASLEAVDHEHHEEGEIVQASNMDRQGQLWSTTPMQTCLPAGIALQLR